MSAKDILTSLANQLGIDHSKITVNNDRVYSKVVRYRNLGMGEAYMDGWWDHPQLDNLFYQIKRKRADQKLQLSLWMKLRVIFLYFLSFFINFQSPDRSKEVGIKHYDLSNHFFQQMLDSKMIYSCAYFGQIQQSWIGSRSDFVRPGKHNLIDNLEGAQAAKLDLICRKVGLEKGMKVLDIGCGWGGFASYAAQKYQVKVVGVTISKEQFEYAKKHNKINDRYGKTLFQLLDYRELLTHPDLHQKYDAVVSIGMLEHVGSQNYRTFMRVVDYVLKDDGLCLVHTIGGSKTRLENDPWFDKYIFPNSLLPTLEQIDKAAQELLVIEDVHNFGAHYDWTLMAWHANFHQNLNKINEERLKQGKAKLDQKFIRMWDYYLLSSAGMFQARHINLYQIVLSGGRIGGYKSIR